MIYLVRNVGFTDVFDASAGPQPYAERDEQKGVNNEVVNGEVIHGKAMDLG